MTVPFRQIDQAAFPALVALVGNILTAGYPGGGADPEQVSPPYSACLFAGQTRIGRLDGDRTVLYHLQAALERFLLMAESPRWPAEIDALERLERAWGRPSNAGPDWPRSGSEHRGYLESRAGAFDAARRVFAERPDELRGMLLEDPPGGGAPSEADHSGSSNR